MATKKITTPGVEEEASEVNSVENGQDLLASLSTPFPSNVERTLSKGGASLTYIPVSEVINRLNRVLGVDGWSFEIVRCERDALDPDFIVAHVRITASSLGNVIKDGFGGQKIKRTRNGDIVDLGDEFKGAVSDALKKAAQQFGVGLYLARSEEALMMDAQADINPEVETLWNEFSALVKSLDDAGRTALNSWWSETNAGAPKPRKETATPEVLRSLIEECTRITFGGTFEEAASDAS